MKGLDEINEQHNIEVIFFEMRMTLTNALGALTRNADSRTGQGLEDPDQAQLTLALGHQLFEAPYESSHLVIAIVKADKLLLYDYNKQPWRRKNSKCEKHSVAKVKSGLHV